MIKPFTLPWFALATAATAALFPLDEVVFNGEEGLERAKTLQVRSATTTEESILSFGEQEHVAGEGMVRTSEYSAQVTDIYGPCVEGRPSRIVRRFGSISDISDMEGGHSDGGVIFEGHRTETDSALEHRVVAFAWDGDEERFIPSFADEKKGEDEWLEGLSADLDLALLLPAGEVEEGDRWELGTEALGVLLQPGGRMLVQPPVEDHEMPDGGIAITMPDAVSIQSWGALDGDVVVEYAGEREHDGLRLAVLELAVDVEGVQDIAVELNRSNRKRGMPPIEYDLADLERAVVGKGQLLWDLERGVLHAYELEVETEMVVEVEWLTSMGEMDMPLAMSQVLSGTVEVELSAE